jgi:two-component system, OmpR family, manganese sensing sensor histidine kinase
MFQQTRRRLALSYTAVMTTILVGFGYGLWLFLQATLLHQLDRELELFATNVLYSLPVREREGRWEVLAQYSPYIRNSQPIRVQWLPGNAPPVEPWSILEGVPRYRQHTIVWDYDGQRLGQLRLQQSLADVDSALSQLTFLLSVGIPVTILLIGLGGWGLAGIAMAPIRDAYQNLQQFTADASHELRTPIAAIQTNAQVLLTSNPEPEDYRRGLGAIERMSQRMGALVQDLLFLARSDAPRTTPPPYQLLNLAILLAQLQEEQLPVAQQAQQQLTLVVDCNSQIQGDTELLARMFLNLISNALTYTPPGGSVRIHLTREGWMTKTTVYDTGIGIAPTEQKRVFERFYRVDRARTRRHTQAGAGMGLAIAQTIARNHGGNITLVSELGQGSAFTVYLPWRGDVPPSPQEGI